MVLKYEPQSLSFSWYSPRELLRISECEVSVPVSFDSFGHPIPDGLYDQRMGPVERGAVCGTCGMDERRCPGHFGHIKLSKPVLHPLLYDTLFGLLRSMCHRCFWLKATDHERLVAYTKVRALRRGVVLGDPEAFVRGRSVEEVEAAVNQMAGTGARTESIRFEFVSQFIRRLAGKQKCPRCGARSPRLVSGGFMRVVRQGPDADEGMTPGDVSELVHSLYANEAVLLDEFFRASGCEMFFLSVLPVIPNRFRPTRVVDGKLFENAINAQLVRIMHTSVATEADSRHWAELQMLVLFYFDSTRSPGFSLGCRQVLEKKDGLFRKNMMGKRVNYAARSVISPDPNLHTSEIGVPLVFASKLTFPERVTSFNIDRLRAMVQRGAEYPGCAFVSSGRGLTDVAGISPEARLAIARQLGDGEKVVWRHLLPGDPVLVNRQPTLHVVSLMAHTVRVLHNEKTLRLHYVNCKPYNADFDGDEMNIHLPQSYTALAECKLLAHNDWNYFVPATGKPIRGLEQDHVVAAAVLTLKDSFFTREEFHALVGAGCSGQRGTGPRGRLVLGGPCIAGPVARYSGKQVITAVLRSLGVRLNYSAKTKLSYQEPHAEEAVLRIRGGAVLTGALDKSTIGATPHSFVHACGEAYGYAFCNDLLTAISRTVNAYLALRGFTVRFDDLLMDSTADATRTALLHDGCTRAAGFQADIITRIGDDFHFSADKSALVDGEMRSFMNNCTSGAVELLSTGMRKPFPSNNMANIILTGAKGSLVNLSQISCLLGQQELEGRRVPHMASGKTLPCFLAGDTAPAAGGYVAERFLSGLNPGTFYFHCMAGREGLIDTAVKTASSGYLQRCLVKHLEGVRVDYDGTVRVDGNIVQFKYGNDGIDPVKETYLKKAELYIENADLFMSKRNPKGAKPDDLFQQGTKLDETKPEDLNQQETKPEDLSKQIYKDQDGNDLFKQIHKDQDGNDLSNQLHDNDLLQQFYGVQISKYSDETKGLLLQILKAAAVDPGKSVGVIAAQSIGEPSTQMTLNTFHLAGVGGKNVTLGIPRLREILMVASKKIKTPMITAPVLKNQEKLEEAFKRTVVSDCIDRINIKESVVQRNGQNTKSIHIIFDIRDHLEECIKALDIELPKRLGKEIKKRTTAVGIVEYSATATGGAETAEQKEQSSDEDSDASAMNQQSSDEEEEEEEDGFLVERNDKEEEEEEDDEPSLVNFRRVSARRYGLEIFYPIGFSLFLLPIVESICSKIVVKEIDGFTRAHYANGLLSMEGSNFSSLVQVHGGIDLADSLDLSKSYSNDIAAVLQNLGIEAARATIVKEIVNVFDVYGISINFRHLHLVADYMTKDGAFAPFCYRTFNMDDSFLQKMSFERCYTYLKNSAIFNQTDTLASPSACIAVGNRMKQGTGSFDVLYQIDAQE